MRETKPVIPDGMLKAACDAMNAIIPIKDASDCRAGFMKRSLEAALRWVGQNPIIPTPEEYWAIIGDLKEHGKLESEWSKGYVEFLNIHIELMRRMFAATPVRGKAAASPPPPVQ